MESKEAQKHLKLSSNPFKAGFQIWWRMIFFQFCVGIPLVILFSFLVGLGNNESNPPGTPSTAPESSS